MAPNQPRARLYVDGFNLYYGSLKNSPYKWLDLEKLARQLAPTLDVVGIRYFTAHVSGKLGALGTAELVFAAASVAVAPSIVGEALLLPAHLATFWAMGQAISNIEQGNRKSCEDIEVWNPLDIFFDDAGRSRGGNWEVNRPLPIVSPGSSTRMRPPSYMASRRSRK